MRILGRDKLLAFRPKDAVARRALAKWEQTAETATWRNFGDLKQTFNSADYVRPHTVFDVGGNKYRVIAVVQYQAALVIVQHVLTHAEYGKGGWK